PSREYRLTADDFTTKAGGYTYNNFDAGGYIGHNDYILESPYEARKNAFENAGTMKDTAIAEMPDISAPEAKGNVTATYYYDPEASGSASAFGGENGTGDFFKGNISCKANTASGYRGTEKYNYSGSFSTSGNITFTTNSQAKLTMIASSTATAPVRMEVTNSADPSSVYHGTFQSGSKGNDVLTTIELLSAGTYTIAPKSNVDFYYIEVAEYDGADVERTLPGEDIPVPPAPEPVLYGDADLNEKIEAGDAAMILQYVLNKSALTVDEKFETRCDVDGENGVTANDAATVLQKTLNGSFKMPVESTDTTVR
ncbi:MAG: dockerin type I repeat-containing protein, partial [Firmicutes bacterium]|nr:dockerin type I repeat-containing protein [Bacillota bacterium]